MTDYTEISRPKQSEQTGEEAERGQNNAIGKTSPPFAVIWKDGQEFKLY